MPTSAAAESLPNPAVGMTHIPSLDGWRALSILLVLACHLVPLGPKQWSLNETAGPMGMALFFVLSGFLITRFLLVDGNLPKFLLRRALRIIPLAWLGLCLAWLVGDKFGLEDWLFNLLFLANIPPMHLQSLTGHYWSLCLEVQFYVLVAALFWIFGRRGFYFLPVFCLAVTAHRVSYGAIADIATLRRADEILVGCVLAMGYSGMFGVLGIKFLKNISRIPIGFLLFFLLVVSHPNSEALNSLRPYAAFLLVASTLYGVANKFIAKALYSAFAAKIAKISYALYVLHPIVHGAVLIHIGEAEQKLAKRVFTIAATFLLAIASTAHFEEKFNALARDRRKVVL